MSDTNALDRIKHLLRAMMLVILGAIPVTEPSASEAFVVSPIKGNLSLVTNKGGNIAISTGEDGLLLVDNGNADEATLLAATLRKFGKGEGLAYIINTHWHDDHSGANNLLGHSADIIAHDNVRKYLSEDRSVPLFNMHYKALESQGLPTITFPQQVNLHINGDLVSLKYYGVGHSDSDIVVFFRNQNVVHMGDSMVYPMYPFIDMEHGGNTFSYIENIRKVLKEINEDTIVIPGHGRLTDKAGMQEFLDMLVKTVEEVRQMKAANLTSLQAQAKGLHPKWRAWGDSAITEAIWIDEIYRSLP
ncbi:MAG: MBL fold metallo-hydrolase [Pseudomonadota bacterium]